MCGNYNHDEKGYHVNNVGTPLPEGTREEDAFKYDVPTEPGIPVEVPESVPSESVPA